MDFDPFCLPTNLTTNVLKTFFWLNFSSVKKNLVEFLKCEKQNILVKMKLVFKKLWNENLRYFKVLIT